MMVNNSHAIDVVVSAIMGAPGVGRETGTGWASVIRASDAVGALGFLTGRVGADRHALDDVARVDGDLVGGRELEREVVETARRRPRLLLADTVVLRTVTTALEPLARRALGDAAPEVRTLLPARDQTALHAGQQGVLIDGLRLRQRLGRVLGDPGPRLGSVEEPVAGPDAGDDVVVAADRHLAAEPAGRCRPEEGDEAGGRERTDAGRHERDRGPVEELPTAHAERLGIGRVP